MLRWAVRLFQVLSVMFLFNCDGGCACWFLSYDEGCDCWSVGGCGLFCKVFGAALYAGKPSVIKFAAL